MIKRDYLEPAPNAQRIANLVRILLLTTRRTAELVSVSKITGSDPRVSVLAVNAKDGSRYQVTVETLD